MSLLSHIFEHCEAGVVQLLNADQGIPSDEFIVESLVLFFRKYSMSIWQLISHWISLFHSIYNLF